MFIALLNPQNATQSRLIKGWLWTGIAAVGFSGLFAILLAAVHGSRGMLDRVIPFADFFRTALVVHVDLSVMVWFLAIAAVLGLLQSRGTASDMVSGAGLASFLTGMALMVVAPFTAEGHPSLNNYIPMLQQPLFAFSIGLIAAGSLLQLWHTLFRHRLEEEDSPLHPLWMGIHIALWIIAAGFALTAASYALLPETITGQEFYEYLYWAGGHIWQFAWVQLMAIGWLWLAEATGQPLKIHSLALKMTLFFPLLILLLSPLPFALYPVDSYDFQRSYTLLMDICNGIYILPVALMVGHALWRGKRPVGAHQRVLYYALITSILLFAVGGLVSLFIEGTNVIIPAHYHGSIVGVTLCFMGLAYALLPKLGYGEVTHWTGRWHTPVYAFGQICHIAGLLISGGYDVARKSTGTVEELGARIGLGLTGAGGGLAIISGILFLAAIVTAVRNRPVGG